MKRNGLGFQLDMTVISSASVRSWIDFGGFRSTNKKLICRLSLG